jgi:hypothetical protein
MKIKETKLIIIDDCDSEELLSLFSNHTPYAMMSDNGSILFHTDDLNTTVKEIIQNLLNTASVPASKNYEGLILLRR